MRGTEIFEDTYWRNGLAAGTSDLKGHIQNRTQILIVGGGYTGLSAAQHLARNGVQVTVVDQEAGPGMGASGRNGGMLLSGYPLDCTSLLQHFGPDRAQELFALSLRAIDGVKQLIQEGDIACDFVPTKHVTAAEHASHWKWMLAEQESIARIAGTLPRLLDADQARQVLGSAKYWGGLVDPWAGSLNPARLVRGLYDMAVDAGATVCWRTKAADLECGRSEARVRTPQGEIRAEQVLLATNGCLDNLHPWLQRRIVPVDSVMIATGKVPKQVMDTVLPQGNTVSDTKRLLHYFRKAPDGKRILFGGRPPIFCRSLQGKARLLYRDMLSVFPQLASYGPEYVWSGHVGFTRDHMPHAGLGNGFGYAAGYCGHGIALATYLGRQIAKALLDREDNQALPFPDATFSGFPLYRKRAWFIPPALAWFSLLDRWGR
jgi:glycine/D-amino acid oxidase-like deaminating enzyme